MQVKQFVRTSLAVTALVVGLVACGSDSDDTKSIGTRGSADVVMSDNPKPHFDPDTLEAPLNSEVSFSIKNESDVVHNFTLSFLDIDEDVQPGETKQITFKVPPPPKGLNYYTFYDKNYQGEGMHGRLKVK